MKIRAAVKRLCEFCYVVRRRAKVYVYCTKNPKVGNWRCAYGAAYARAAFSG